MNHTLTIMPGTKVYFGDGPSFRPGPPGTSDNPSNFVDLIVHGKLVANGTSTRKILFSSIAAAVEATGTHYAPVAGQWGYMYFNGHAASQLNWTTVAYGAGIWSDGTGRPYVLNSWIHDTGDRAIYMEQPKKDATTPRPRFVGNNIAAGSQTGIRIYWLNNTTNDVTIDPYIAWNTIAADYCIDLELYDNGVFKGGNHKILGDLNNNKLQTTGSNEAVYLQTYTRRYKSAKVQTKLTNNTILAQDDDGIYGYAYNYDYGPAWCSPKISGGKIAAYDSGVHLEATSAENTSANIGNAYVSPNISNVSITGQWDDAVYCDATSNSRGAAKTNPSLKNVKIESADSICLYAYATSVHGPAYSSPMINKCTSTSNDGDIVYDCEAYGDGYCQTNPQILGGSMKAQDSEGLYCDADSDMSRADCMPYLEDVYIHSYNECLELYAYGSQDGLPWNGPSTCAPIVLGCTFESYYDYGIYTESGSNGKGTSNCSPLVVGSSITGDDDHGIYAESDSVDGNAYASPVVDTCDVSSYDSCVYADATRNSGGSSTLNASAIANPRIEDSMLFSKDYETLEGFATNNNKGVAQVKPDISDSDLKNGYDDESIYLTATKAEGTAGNAEVSPSITNVTTRSDYQGLYMHADGPGLGGAAIVGGSVRNSSIKATEDYGVDILADNSNGGGVNGGNALVRTTFTNVKVDAPDDYAYYLVARGGGPSYKSCEVVPSITGGWIRSGDGIYANADVTQAGATSAHVISGPHVTNCPIQAQWDYGVEARANTNGAGYSSTRANIYNCPMYVYDSGLYATSRSVNGNAFDASTCRGKSSASRMRLEAFDDYGVDTSVDL